MRARAKDILERKSGGHTVWALPEEATVAQALELMLEHRVGAVPVVSAGKVVGIFSERDHVRLAVEGGAGSGGRPLSEVMTRGVILARPGDLLLDCLEIMTERRIRHLPVVGEDGVLMGILSIGDLVKTLLAAKDRLIGDLEGYISGRPFPFVDGPDRTGLLS